MIRLGKLTDYGLVLMTCMARSYGTPLDRGAGDCETRDARRPSDPEKADPSPSFPAKIAGSGFPSQGANSALREARGFGMTSRPAAPALAGSLRTARDLAAETKLPVSTVSKLLKHLLQSGLLASHRGTKGGYLLARDPHEISVLEVIAAVEGPMALTECSTDVSGCQIETGCPIKSNQRIINQAVRGVLEKVMLSDLANPMQLTSITDVHGRALSVIGPAITSRIQ